MQMKRLIAATTLFVLSLSQLPAVSLNAAALSRPTNIHPLLLQPGGNAGCRMAIRGAKQGQFKGQGLRGPDKWIPCSQFLLSLNAPREAGSGMATGRRQYSPVVVTKDWGAASPQILQAAATNEVLPLVEFEFMKVNPQGQEYVFQTVTLTNATISAVKQYIGFPDAGEPPNPHALEDVSFVFQKIEVTNNDGKTTFIDEWSGPR